MKNMTSTIVYSIMILTQTFRQFTSEGSVAQKQGELHIRRSKHSLLVVAVPPKSTVNFRNVGRRHTCH